MNYNPLLVFTTYNQLDMTRKCMEYAQDLGYDILMIDDCSTDGTQEYISQIRVEALLKNKRRGLTDSWNRAYAYFKASSYSHIVICNKDVLIPKGAIEGMLSDYPLVVPMCNESGAGYACKEQSIERHDAWLMNPEDEFNIPHIQQLLKLPMDKGFKPVECWTGFCMCMSRRIIEDERDDGNLFYPGNINVGNDDDLARRVEAYIALGSFVYHHKGVSFNGQIADRDNLNKDY